MEDKAERLRILAEKQRLEESKRQEEAVTKSTPPPTPLPTPPPTPPRAPVVEKKLETPVRTILNTNFFRSMNSLDKSRDYTIIVDKSSSMKMGGRMKQAENSVKVLAESLCQCDDDGISLYFFSSHSKTNKGDYPAFNKYENVKTADGVMALFQMPENVPRGGTDLTKVLRSALSQSSEKNQSILIITDGVPDDTKSSEELLIATANSLLHENALHITIVQVGDDTRADNYLHELDANLVSLGAKYDIVDVVSAKKLNGMDLSAIVQISAGK